jgi:hypothetical protein
MTAKPASENFYLKGTPMHTTGPTGPRTTEGKAIACLNNLRHGLTGAFRVLPTESQSDFDTVLASLREEHNPQSATEDMLVSRMAEHAWLIRRAQQLQDAAILAGDDRKLALYLRYGTSNERAFSKCLNDLLRIARHAREFESQRARVRLVNARAAGLEFATELKSTVQAPIPGHSPIPLGDRKLTDFRQKTGS